MHGGWERAGSGVTAGTRAGALLAGLIVGLLAVTPAAGAVTLTGARGKALAATKAERQRGGVILFSLRAPIRRGASIREAGRRPPPPGSSRRTMRSVLRAGREPTYFFYLDRGAYQAYEHPGRVLLVGARTGRVVRSRTLRFAPVINGRLPTFLSSREGYDAPGYRVWASRYAVAGATARAARTGGLGAFAADAAPRSAASEGLVASRLAAEKSCTIVIGGRRPNTLSTIGSTTGTPVMPVLFYSPSSGISLASFVAKQAIATRGCRDILIAISGDGYRSLSSPSVRTHLRASGARMREFHVTSAMLRSIIGANPSVTFKLMIDAPGSGAFVEALRSLGNVLVISTSSTASQTAYRYLPSKSVAGSLTGNPLRMRADSSFFTTQLFGSAAFAASDAEVVHAAAEVAAHRAPSFLAYMVARAFALSRPFDFTSDLGATQRLYVHGFTPTPPPVVQPNRPPEALSQAVTTAEDSAKAITLGAGDPDGTPLTFTVSSPAHGTLTGTAPNLTYTPAHDYDGPDSFTFTASDGSLTSATATVTITVTPIDDPPVITTSAGPLGSTDGGPATPVDAGLVLTDPDSQITGATVRISGNHASPEDVLALASRPNITAAYDSATGTLTLTGTDTVADYQAALRAVTYRNTSGNPSTLTRTVTFLASDASSTSAPATRDINISPSDNAPDVVGSAGSLTYTENASPTAIDAGLTVTDPDSMNLTGATVRITTGYALGEDVLALPAQPAITGGFDAPTGVLTLTGTATVAAYQAALRAVTYVDTSDDPSTAPRILTFTARDVTGFGTPATHGITIVAVDDPPVASDDAATVAEDSGASAVAVLPNDADVDAGPKSIASVTQPAHGAVVVTGGGTGLTYQPNANVCNSPPGTTPDTFSYTLAPGGSTATVSMTVTCVDDPPVAVDDAQTVAEDSGASAIGVLVNDTDSDGGPKSIASVTQPANGTVVITGGGTGLTYQPNANSCNSPPGTTPDTFTYTLTPGSSAATVSIAVTCVDDPPLAGADNATVLEDSGANAIDVLANDVDPDGGPRSIQSVTQGTQGATVVITGGGSGLTYAPAANFCNTYLGGLSETFTYTLNGGSSTSVAMTVTCVPDNPNVTTSAGTTTYVENAAPTKIDASVTVTDPDPDATIAGATVRISANSAAGQDVLALSGSHPGITAAFSGDTLTLSGSALPSDYQSALRDVTYVNTSDNPGTLTRTITFTVTDDAALTDSDTKGLAVQVVDDPPVAVDDAFTVLEDSGATAQPVTTNDTDVDGGPKTIQSTTQPAHGTVVVTGGGTGLTYAPAANSCNDPTGPGPDTFTYTLNGGSTATVSVTVTCVNDNPVAVNDTFNAASSAVGNTALVVDAPGDGPPTAAGPKKARTGNILANDSDVDGPSALSVVPGTFASNDGGSVVIESDGDFVFTPAPGTSCSDTSDFFDYTVSDHNTPTPGTATGRVDVTISGCVWYVDNTAAGNGTSTAPFSTLAQAQTASVAGSDIFVFDGNTTSTGLDAGVDLDNNQRLIGEAADLVVGTDTLWTGDPAKRPVLTDPASDVVALASGDTVRGVQLDPQGASAIAGGAGDNAGTIDDVRILDTGTAATQPQLVLNGTSGAFGITGLTIDDSGAPSASTGVLLNANTGSVDFATTTITSNGGKALDAAGTNLATSQFDAITVTNSATGAVRMSNTTGTTAFGDNVATDLSLQTTSGAAAAFDISNAGPITVQGGGTGIDTISATGGPAVDITNTSGSTFQFGQVSSTNSSGDGINFVADGTSTFIGTSAGTIGGTAGIAVDVGGGDGNFTYSGTIANGAGGSARIQGRTGGNVMLNGPINDSNDNGGGVTVTGNSGGTTTFGGSSTTLNTGTAPGVSFTSSDGHALRFVGAALHIDTTSGAGLDAPNSGTLEVSGPSNSITTGSGRALNVANTDISANNVTFQSISSNGAASGILLNNTAGAGHLAVTGNGGTCTGADQSGCSGGQIRNTTGADDSSSTPAGTGIVLKDTTAPTLTRMWVHDNSNYAIRGTNVAGMTLANSVVNGVNGNNGTTPFDDSSVWIDNLTGSASVDSTFVSGGFEDNLRVVNSSGSLNRITLNADTFGVSGSTPNNDAVLLESSATAGQLLATVQNSTFQSAGGDLLQFDHNAPAAGDLVLTGNGFSNANPTIATGGGGLSLFQGGVAGGNTTMTIDDNTFRDAVGPGVLAVKSIGPATQTGTFTNNVIGVAASTNSGSAAGSALKLQSVDKGTINWTVTNNTIRGYNNFGIEVEAGGGSAPQSGTINTTITGNTITQPGNTPGTITIPKQGIHYNIGTVPGDTFQACANIRSNNLDTSGADSSPSTINVDVRLRQRQNTTIRLPGYAGANNDNAAVQSFVAANNSAGTSVLAQNTVGSGGGGFVGAGTTCP